ncbi:MAG: LPS assembly lipoprotein LptE [Sulfurovaceae bacterium]|nr:LPS assembly lipoprotein LptE [Sulfurovaceae bacterium]
MLKIYRSLITALFVLWLAGCGYQPSSHMVKKIFDDSVYVEVQIDPSEPENAPYLADELRRVIITRFNGNIAPKEQANNVIKASYKGTQFIPLSYDRYGYTTRYQTIVNVEFTIITKTGKKIVKTITTTDEAGISESALQTSTMRIASIKNGLEKAVDAFMAYVSAKGAIE